MSTPETPQAAAPEAAGPVSAAEMAGVTPVGEGEATYKRKKRKKRDLDDKGSLTINSLMDILTIILVFLIKNYSADPVQIKQAPDMQLPFAFSRQKPEEATNVTITMRSITVVDKKVVALENGKVAAADMQGDFLIQPLLDALADEVEHYKKVAKYNKKSEFKGLMTIICDREVPFNLLTKVMYTAGQAEFSKWKFAVIKSRE